MMVRIIAQGSMIDRQNISSTFENLAHPSLESSCPHHFHSVLLNDCFVKLVSTGGFPLKNMKGGENAAARLSCLKNLMYVIYVTIGCGQVCGCALVVLPLSRGMPHSL